MSLAMLRLGRAVPAVVDPRAPAVGASDGYHEVFLYTEGIIEGSFSVASGTLHPLTTAVMPPAPVGAPVNVLRVGTSMNGFAIRDYARGQVFLLPRLPAQGEAGWTVVDVAAAIDGEFDPLGDPTDPTGWRATWNLAPLGEPLELQYEVEAMGASPSSAAAVLRVRLFNGGPESLRLGLRVRTDVDIGHEQSGLFPPFGTAGPNYAPWPPCPVAEPLSRFEESWLPGWSSWVMNGRLSPSQGAWLYWVTGSIAGPVASYLPQPTPPEILQIAPEDTFDLADLRHSAFMLDHRVPPRSCGGDFGGSSGAMNYLWGASETSAITLAPGASREFVMLFGAYLDHPMTCMATQAAPIECTGSVHDIGLDATSVTSPQHPPVEVLWRAPLSVEISDPNAVVTSARVTGLGEFAVDALALLGPFQGHLEHAFSVVDTSPPVIEAPGLVEVATSQDGGSDCLVEVSVEALATDTCAGTDVAVANTWSGMVPIATRLLPVGRHSLSFMARDPSGNAVTHATEVIVHDDTPPVIQRAEAVTSAMWPPNHRLRDVTVTLQATDNCDAAPRMRLESVVSSEPSDGLGDGSTDIDIVDATIGSDDRDFKVRAERSGAGGGRHYVARYSVQDASGNVTFAEIHVDVDHDRGRR